MGITRKPWLVYFVVLFLFFSFTTYLSIAADTDTISSGQSITGSQTITSLHGIFELGFFTPGNSKNYYIGIWYKQHRVQTVVWVANRDKPLPNTSSRLKISEDGNLVLLNQSNISIWSTNLSSNTLNYTSAALLDSGNLVLRDGSNSSVVLWQSFEHPTDTWLPGGRLGLNKITGETQLLASWRNSENPSPGIFSLERDRNGTDQYFLLWNNSQRYWTTGVWNGKFFNSIPEMMAPKYLFDFSYVSNEKEAYFTYTVRDSSFLSRLVMDLSGQTKQFTWLNTTQEWLLLWTKPNDRCEAYSLCGAFSICISKNMPLCECLQGFEPWSPRDWNLSDWSGGCVRKTPLQCGSNSSSNGQKDGFLMMPNMQFPTDIQNFRVKSAHECKLACLNNCSCSAYAYSGRCSIWNGGLRNLKQLSYGDTGGGDIYLRLSASDLPSFRGKKKKAVIIGAVSGVLTLLGVAFVLILRHRRRMLMRTSKTVQGSLVPFGYRDLQNMTKNFAEKLGGGGFGSVFKGILPDSTVIAVKKLEGLGQGEKEFRAEVTTIGTIQHVNLVRLRGFCSEGTKRLLVYDYLPNGSLDTHLFYKDSKILDWKTRYQIALGTARGLAYLHEKCRDCIIHCDIKPGNILLDAEFCAKVADFGMAKLFGRDFSRVLTTMRGTRGYLAPEWISGLAITPKADVYSYGMMLFEIISGRRNIKPFEDGKVDFIPIWVASNIHNDNEVASLVDQKLEGKVDLEELTRASRVACWCIQDDEKDRPSMGQIVQILEGVIEVGIPPIPLYLQTLVEPL